MARLSISTVNDVTNLSAHTVAVPVSASGEPFVALNITLHGLDGQPVTVSMYMPFDRADYARRIADAINSVSDVRPAQFRAVA